VLCLVASRLAGVSGGGQAYRVGGEEFSILFPGKSLEEVLPHVEFLRKTIASSSFRVRAGLDRRRSKAPIHKDERRAHARRARDRANDRENEERQNSRPVGPRRSARRRTRNLITEAVGLNARNELSVTVSIGVAEPTGRNQEVERVILAADKALYRAKQGGRNRVEARAPVERMELRQSETAKY
jgi:GGDEF domain-containing protein